LLFVRLIDFNHGNASQFVARLRSGGRGLTWREAVLKSKYNGLAKIITLLSSRKAELSGLLFL